MDRVHLLPMQLPPASSINGHKSNNGYGNGKGKVSFVRRLALGFMILAGLGLLYVPAYHSAQGQFSGLGETPSPQGSVGVQLRGWSYNTTRDVSTYIRPENNTTAILNPSNICGESAYLLIVVCSAVTNVNARLTIRNTWGNQSNLDVLYDSSVKLVFLLGLSGNDTINDYVVDESHLYNDVIQEHFHDSYNNLTLKSLMMLKWATTYCDKITYLMKSDDDMFINVPALIKALKARAKSTGTLIGSLICNAKPVTDIKNKWYTPKYMYSERTYPNYLSGTGYVMSLDVARRIYKAALAVPLLHLEDVYITGICAKKIGLRPANQHGFSYIPRKLETCALREVITAHKINASTMNTIWSKLSAAEDAETNGTSVCTASKAVDKKRATITAKVGMKRVGYFLMKSGRTFNNRCV
ncbi:beta-1,3-galactosyltransferase 1 isoform X2 [Copidosoma floridanum]|uniref:beta-1,3-galactosyltransferase 1 isoform X2 n=1 Tax=Copidosoma floridanum TaxID=29053 RepID=UPI0006C97612|nr:beta-1,3-galactosyltransferase 1 isoform X2 [Copidosoma floridanum]